MNILITAGGTSEKIDSVRSITNHSTGRLGKTIAELFLTKGHNVTYITTPTAERPKKSSLLKLVEITTTQELADTIYSVTRTHSFDSIVHSMAVSDYTTETACSEEMLIESLLSKLETSYDTRKQTDFKKMIQSSLNDIASDIRSEKKIASTTDRLLLFLKKNPKIIATLRELQPKAIIVGFKLLVEVPKEELIQVGHTILKKNNCNFVFANDLKEVGKQDHKGFLLDEKGIVGQAQTKVAIADLIVTAIEKEMED